MLVVGGFDGLEFFRVLYTIQGYSHSGFATAL